MHVVETPKLLCLILYYSNKWLQQNLNSLSLFQKRDDFRYANGPSYCISHALMAKVEKYLRYKCLNILSRNILHVQNYYYVINKLGHMAQFL